MICNTDQVLVTVRLYQYTCPPGSRVAQPEESESLGNGWFPGFVVTVGLSMDDAMFDGA